jgi:prolipoprotein diacylglyceryltransferase
VWLGGIAWPGALAGGILGTVIVGWISRISIGVLADRLLPLLASLSVTVWLGCWLTGCAYGPELDWGFLSKDEMGVWEKRLPLQLIGAILVLAMFWWIARFRPLKKDWAPGLAASLGLGGLSLILLGASLLRVDPYPIYNGLRLETWAAFILIIISVFGGVLAVLLDR